MEQFAAQIWQQQQQDQQKHQHQQQTQQHQLCASEQLAAVELNELQKQQLQQQQQEQDQRNTSTVLVVDNNNKLPAIEATIIDIPLPSAPPSLSCTTTTASAATALEVKTSTTTSPSSAGGATARSSLSSSSSSSSTSYDTDSSTTSSTCCTRHGEHIYMEKAQHNKMQQQQQHHQQQQQQYACNEDPEACDLKAGHRLHWPLFMLLISIIEVAIFAYDSATVPATATTRQLIANMPIPSDSVFIYRPDRRLQVWRFLSYMFLHANWFHLGFNVVIQLFYGIPLEMMHGSARIAIVYCAGVFAGALGTSVVDSEVYLVGASGGVYAILAAHLANLTLNYRQMRFASVQLLAVLIFVNCDLGYALYTQYLDSQFEKPPPAVWPNYDPPPVSYVAHMTGALAGFTIGLLVLKNFEHRPFENLIWWLALGVYSAFTVFAIVFNLINTMTGQLVEERSEVVAQQLLYDLGVS